MTPASHLKAINFLAICLLSTFIFPFTDTLTAQNIEKRDTANYPYWVGMMQDDNVNFFQVQHAFETYWKDRPVTRSSGFKPFKRWEYMMSLRVSPDGKRPSPDKNWKAYKDYFGNQGKLENNNGNWEEMGPKYLPINAPGLGRVNALAFHPTDVNIIYAGAPAGGFWKSTDGGQLWTSNTDGLPTLGVSAIIVDHSNPDILYIGTGDRDAGDAAGIGVMKSIDAGINWALSNNGMGYVTVGKMLIHPVLPGMLYAATSGGIFKTINGGADWFNISPSPGNYKDIVFRPNDPTTLYATRDGLFYKSVNEGANWMLISNGLPGGSRGVIGVSQANPDYVYFMLSYSDAYKGMYLSTDGGETFVEQSTTPNILSWGCDGGTGGQAWYDLCIAVDPLDAHVLYVGGVNIFKSTDAGQTWLISAHWYGGCSVAFVHADQHVFNWNPLNGSLYVGNDGGCFYTSDNGGDWVMISQGLSIAQVYKIGQSAQVKDMVINGYQDNGTAVFGDQEWRNVMGGDGMECAIDPTNANYKYGTLYYGAVSRIFGYDNQGGIGGNGVNGINEEGAWVSPFIIHETDPNTMFLGLKSVWRSNNIKAYDVQLVTWTKISTNFGSGNCRVLEQSPANPDILYVIKESGNLWRSDDANSANPGWINLTNNLPASISNASDIECHPTDPGTAYLTSSGHIYKTTNKGQNWSDITGSLPDVFYSGIVYCKGSQEGLYACSDIGVYYRDASMTDWVPFSNGLPLSSRVMELEIFYDHYNPQNNVIRGCTYGRGLWQSTLYHSQPAALFTSDHTTLPMGCGFNFTDLSFGFPTSWHWTFTGGTPVSSTQQNPQNITYALPGTYDVTLVVTNDVGSDSLTVTGYITVSPTMVPNPGFYCSDSIFCSGPHIVTFYDTSKYCPQAWVWSFNPTTVTFLSGTGATSQNPVVQFNEDGQYSVTLTVGNVNGSVNLNKTNLISIGGRLLPFFDNFESGNLNSKSWTVLNPDGDKTWEVWNTGGNPPGTKAARVKIYGTNTLDHKDKLISPPLNLTGIDHPTLQFKHAYCQYQTQYSDTLIVMASDNCGTTWTQLYKGFDDGSGLFATHPPMTSNFDPSAASDWCGNGLFGSPCLWFDLTAYGGKKDVQLAFETISYMSNNLYIDDVNITQSNGIIDNQDVNEAVVLFPNPSDGLITLTVKQGTILEHLRVVTPQGQEIWKQETAVPGNYPIDLSRFAKGLYYLEGITGQGKVVKKILVGK
ncbi:MAG: PKD domain-containing protein [Bacteroidetes bacterium]|nr:PKD domain-containing protein [Bacteroidota bacterium]